MNQHSNPGQPNADSIAIQQSSVPHPIPLQIDIQHPQPSSSITMGEQAAVTIANPKTPAKLVIVAENVAKASEQQVDFSVSQQDAQLNTVRFAAESAPPTARTSPRSAPFASMGNSCFHKGQEQFYSVGQAAPTLTRPSSPDYSVAFIWFGISAFFLGLFFVLRQDRLNSDKNLREEAKRNQNLYEIGSEKRKEVSNIARILENSEFLNILILYKMQKVNLTEAKDLLSTKFELPESDILLILKIV